MHDRDVLDRICDAANSLHARYEVATTLAALFLGPPLLILTGCVFTWGVVQIFDLFQK